LQGAAPKDLALNLYKPARFKCRSFSTELNHFNWIKNLIGINTTTQMEEFTLLFMALASVSLSEQPDTII
jgi:hypothetical protein